MTCVILAQRVAGAGAGRSSRRIPPSSGGVYSALGVPVVELTVDEEPAVVVLFTHDCGLAARVAWPLWCEEQGGELTRPVRHWWRREPVDPATVERDGYEHMWWPARPGRHGAGVGGRT